jgi:hypothetical protein
MTPHDQSHTNGLYTYDRFGGGKKPRRSHFLWWCAGAHQDLLADYPSEHAKYAGLGGIILATFVLAAVSAGYAMYSVFSHWAWALAFGLLWGAIIFNLDRFLVSTMRKYGVAPHKQFFLALPRIVLALLISLTIARPLEIKIFEKEIGLKVIVNRHRDMLHNDSLLREENRSQLLTVQAERERLLNRKLAIEDSLHRLQIAYLQEADGTGGSLQRGIERLTALKKDAYDQALIRLTPEYNQIGGQLRQQDSTLTQIAGNQDAKRKDFEARAAAPSGFLERNKALADLSDEESSVFWAMFLLSVLIILIETAPVLAKLILHAGPYDLALARLELMQMAEAENDMRRRKMTEFDKMENLYQQKKEVSEEAMGRLKDLQKKHIHREMDRWEQGDRTPGNPVAVNDLMKRIKEQFQVEEENFI